MISFYPEKRQLTPNRRIGQNTCEGVLLHHTAGRWASDLATLTTPRGADSVSAHVLIGLDGLRMVLADDRDVTWHAGRSSWRGKAHCNNFMIGVELEGNTLEQPLTEAQVLSLMEYLVPRMLQHRWTPAEVTHHRVVSPGRKVDLEPKQFERVQMVLQAWNSRGRALITGAEMNRIVQDLRAYDRGGVTP